MVGIWDTQINNFSTVLRHFDEDVTKGNGIMEKMAD